MKCILLNIVSFVAGAKFQMYSPSQDIPQIDTDNKGDEVSPLLQQKQKLH
jgi:hypothetical protein